MIMRFAADCWEFSLYEQYLGNLPAEVLLTHSTVAFGAFSIALRQRQEDFSLRVQAPNYAKGDMASLGEEINHLHGLLMILCPVAAPDTA